MTDPGSPAGLDAIVGRSLSWKRSLIGIPAHDRGEWADGVGGWLMDLFEPNLV